MRHGGLGGNTGQHRRRAVQHPSKVAHRALLCNRPVFTLARQLRFRNTQYCGELPNRGHRIDGDHAALDLRHPRRRTVQSQRETFLGPAPGPAKYLDSPTQPRIRHRATLIRRCSTSRSSHSSPELSPERCVIPPSAGAVRQVECAGKRVRLATSPGVQRLYSTRADMVEPRVAFRSRQPDLGNTGLQRDSPPGCRPSAQSAWTAVAIKAFWQEVFRRSRRRCCLRQACARDPVSRQVEQFRQHQDTSQCCRDQHDPHQDGAGLRDCVARQLGE